MSAWNFKDRTQCEICFRKDRLIQSSVRKNEYGACRTGIRRRRKSTLRTIMRKAEGILPMRISPQERFEAKRKVLGPNECWPWLGGRSGQYGKFWDGKQNEGAHRFAFFLANGYLPKGCVMHACNNPLCTAPHHLIDGDIRRNTIQAVQDGLVATKIPIAEVPAIRTMSRAGARVKDLAEKFGVSAAHMSKIISGKRWGHVPDYNEIALAA